MRASPNAMLRPRRKSRPSARMSPSPAAARKLTLRSRVVWPTPPAALSWVVPSAPPTTAGGDMATRIGIIGAGAIGSIVGGMLTKAGHDVTLMEQWPEHVEGMKKVGLRLSGTCGEHVVPVKALHIHEMQGLREPFDYVFISVKSYDTEWATAMAVAHLRKPDGVVVDFQNGINDERVAGVAGRERTLGCVITISRGMYEAAHAIRTDTG